jgi:hypothetical protein
MEVKVKAKVKGTGNPNVKFTTGTLNRKLYIPLLSIGKKLGGEKKKNDYK